MLKIIQTIDEALNFFLRNSSDPVICRKDGKEKECNSYSEAKKFYEED